MRTIYPNNKTINETNIIMMRREYFPENHDKRTDSLDVSILLPAFNERENLEILIDRLILLLDKARLKFEIIVIDDNSPDGSHQFVREKASIDRRIHLIRRIDERGLSSAIVTGMASASGRNFIVMDSDLQHDESIIPLMIDELKSADVVVASRLAEHGSYGQMSWWRRMLSWGATYLARLIVLVKVSDPMSGFFGIRRESFESVADRLNPKGFKILLEILAKDRSMKVSEVGYSFRRRLHGQTKLDSTVMIQYVLGLLEIRFGRAFSPMFFRYAVIGSLGVVVNLLGQFIAASVLGFNFDQGGYFLPSMAVVFGFELSVVFNYIANNAWTFKQRRRYGLTSNLIGFLKFHGVALYGFLIQLSIWHLIITQNQPIVSDQLMSYVANLAGILFATVNNYYLNKNFTWSRPTATTDRKNIDSNVVYR